MLKFRIAAPADLIAPLQAELLTDQSVSSVVLHRGASVKPGGDVLEFDVARETANDLVDRLVGLGTHHQGTVQIEQVPTWISRPAHEAEQLAPGSSADSVVWAEVVQRAYEESELNFTYLSFMTLATFISAVAIVVDSQILVIGAMVLGPEFIPIAAIGVGLVKRRRNLLRRAVGSLLIGFGISIVIVTLVCLLARAVGWITLADVVHRSQTAFIYSPNKWSFVIALAAAAAGVLSLTSARLGGLSGVFISVTTIPAVGNIALGLAFGAFGEVRGSLLQLLMNITGMALAGWATLALQQATWSRMSANQRTAVNRWRPRRDRPGSAG